MQEVRFSRRGNSPALAITHKGSKERLRQYNLGDGCPHQRQQHAWSRQATWPGAALWGGPSGAAVATGEVRGVTSVVGHARGAGSTASTALSVLRPALCLGQSTSKLGPGSLSMLCQRHNAERPALLPSGELWTCSAGQHSCTLPNHLRLVLQAFNGTPSHKALASLV